MTDRNQSLLYYATREHFRALDPNLSIHLLSQLARVAIDEGYVRHEMNLVFKETNDNDR